MLLWAIFGSVVALAAGIVIDLAGLLPTIRKTCREPWTEDRLAWTISFAGAMLNMIAVKSWTFAIGIYPIYMFVAHLGMMILLFRPREKT